jgi:hypothetical protein
MKIAVNVNNPNNFHLIDDGEHSFALARGRGRGTRRRRIGVVGVAVGGGVAAAEGNARGGSEKGLAMRLRVIRPPGSAAGGFAQPCEKPLAAGLTSLTA